MADSTARDCLVADCGRPPLAPAAPPRSYAGVDLMARDYDSLLRLLLDRLAQRAPDWRDRSEADLGMVLLELMAYAGDQLAWLQERVALEGRLRTATRLESVQRLLRLIDCPLHPGLSARALLQFEVEGPVPLVLPSGFAARTRTAASAGGAEPVVFETSATALLVPALGRMALAADVPGGADGRELRLAADVAAWLADGQALLLQQGRLREVVQVHSALAGAVTVVTLRAAPSGRYAAAAASVHGNLVDATHGQSQRLQARGSGAPRQLIELERAPVAQVADAAGQPRSTLRVAVDGEPWSVVEDFIDSGATDTHYRATCDAGGHVTLVFGDGEHGAVVPDGADIGVQWRVGLGMAGRVAADTLCVFEPGTAFALGTQRIVAVRNPLPSAGARDPDTVQAARLLGPASLRQLDRAVTPGDYETVLAQGVDHGGRRWVPLQCRARRVHTGAWPVVVVSVDLPGHQPLAAVPGLQQAFEQFLSQRKLAGLSVQVEDARFCPLHIALKVEVAPGHFARDVRRAVEQALLGPVQQAGSGAAPPLPPLAPGALRFGQAVHLSDLYAAAAAVEGVQALTVTRFKRLGNRHPDRAAAGLVEVGALEIARCDGLPDSGVGGLLFVRTVGGREG